MASVSALAPITTHPVFVGCLIISACGIIVSIIKIFLTRKKPNQNFWLLFVSRIIPITFLASASFLKLSLPSRYLHDAVMLMIPFSSFMIMALLKKARWGLVRAILPITIILILSTAFIPRMDTYAKTFNTNWNEIELIEWSHHNLKPDARIITDPFTFFMMLSSIPYMQDLSRSNPETKAIFTLEAGYEKIIAELCPDAIIIDYPQTYQFFGLKPLDQYAQDHTFNVALDHGQGIKRVLALKPDPSVCTHQ